ncbi:unnamed protein product [Blepharisma stoltei]|uniref:Uncharacterized protein n=1 Tax=Blepharisma stoltei TaxID=1481888 RepID=A0AAU9K8M0_9CILI|nr:unnamed protein product [Blepharisma stoltei]
MDIPKILEHLKDFHQNALARDEIINFRQDIRSLINTSLQNGLFRAAQPNHSIFKDNVQNTYVHKLNNLFPKSSQCNKFNIFQQFAKYSSKLKLNINLPTTLLRTDDSSFPVLLRTKIEGHLETHSNQNIENKFFECLTKKPDPCYPSICYKSAEKDVSPLFSVEDAKEIWKLKENNSFLQSFIHCKCNPLSITRIVWKKCAKEKYYTIVNRSKVRARSVKSSEKNKKKSMKQSKSYSNLCDFKYMNMMQPLSQSVNNPYKLKSRTTDTLKPKFTNSSADLSRIAQEAKEPTSISCSASFLAEDNFNPQENPLPIDKKILSKAKGREFLVNTKEPDSCYAIENNTKITPIEKMTDEIVNFLNTYLFCQQALGGIVLDFIQDQSKNWFLLDCKEYFIDYKLPIEVNVIRKQKTKVVKSRRARSVDESINKKSEETERREKESDNGPEEAKKEEILPFKIRTKPCLAPQNMCNEKELVERYNNLYEKVNKIISNKKPNFSFNPPDEGFHSYPFSNNNFSQSSNELKNSQPYQIRAGKRRRTNKSIDSLWADQQYICTKKTFCETVDHFDEIVSKIQMSKAGIKDLVQKYGGSQFWDEFILSLYNKILCCDTLGKYFKDSKLKDFERIHTGIFKVFSGNVGMDLRRKIRAVHHNMGINEIEFDTYTELFFKTLEEFNIQEVDKRIIASQIRSMKSLICKQI